MNLQFYLEKLKSSEEYKKFMKENSDAYLCSGFFIIDLENLKKPDDKSHFDFYVPSKKEMFSFQLENEIKIVPIETLDKRIPEKIGEINFEFGEVERMIEKRMQEENLKNKIQKILLSLQKLSREDFLVGNVFISGFGILKINIDISEKKITLFEKKSLFDMIRKS